MAWTPTGKRRTLKLKITKTEVNDFEEPVVTIIDGNTTDFTGGTSYDWGLEDDNLTPLTMGRASLAAFQTRTGQTYDFIVAHFPVQAYGNINWGNFRVGAEVAIVYTGAPNDTSFTITLREYDSSTETIGNPINADETIRIKFTYYIIENGNENQKRQNYQYIAKNTTGTTINLSDTNVQVFFPNLSEYTVDNMWDCFMNGVAEIVNVDNITFSDLKLRLINDGNVGDVKSQQSYVFYLNDINFGYGGNNNYGQE